MITPEDEERKKFIRFYQILAVVLGILGAILLTLGIITYIMYNENDVHRSGMPIFIGGFIVGITALLSACVCVCILMKAQNADSDVKKNELACPMLGHFILSVITIIGCFGGTWIALICVSGTCGSGLEQEHEYYYNVIQKYAAASIALCIISASVTVCLICTIRKYRSSFKVTKNSREAISVTRNNTGNAAITQTQTFGNDQTIATGFRMGLAPTDQIRQLQEQNRILQEQLELQIQLQQNQNPFQYHYDGGFYSSPSASYEFSGGRYSPPPSYHSVE